MIDQSIVGKFVQILQRDGFRKAGVVVSEDEDKIIIQYFDGRTKMVVRSFIAEIKIGDLPPKEDEVVDSKEEEKEGTP